MLIHPKSNLHRRLRRNQMLQRHHHNPQRNLHRRLRQNQMLPKHHHYPQSNLPRHLRNQLHSRQGQTLQLLQSRHQHQLLQLFQEPLPLKVSRLQNLPGINLEKLAIAIKIQQLWTEDLISCLGIAIVGTSTGLPYDKILAHFYVSNVTLDTDFQKLENNVNSIRMKDQHVYLSVPDPRMETIPEWGSEMAEFSERVTQLAMEKADCDLWASSNGLEAFFEACKISEAVLYRQLAGIYCKANIEMITRRLCA